jgi:hypothetical protein
VITLYVYIENDIIFVVYYDVTRVLIVPWFVDEPKFYTNLHSEKAQFGKLGIAKYWVIGIPDFV